MSKHNVILPGIYERTLATLENGGAVDSNQRIKCDFLTDSQVDGKSGDFVFSWTYDLIFESTLKALVH